MSDEMTESVGDVLDDFADEEVEETDAPAGEGEQSAAPARAEHKEPVPDPAKKPEPKNEEPPKPKTYRVKVNGKDQDVPGEHADALAAALGVDVNDLLGGARMFKAGQEKFRLAAEEAKKAQALVERLKKDPKAALREALGGDDVVAALAIETVRGLMEAESLTPEQRRIRELEAEQAQVKAEREEKAKEVEQAEAQQFQSRVATKLDGELKAALQAGKLPSDPYVVKRVASLMLDHLKNGGDADDLTVADFVPLAMDGMQKEHAAFLGKLSGEQIASMFPEVAEKVRQYHVGRVKGRRAVPAEQSAGGRRPAQAKTFASIGAVLRDF
jgi:hypothetical protein